MGEKKQLVPRKHIAKKTTAKQELVIEQIKEEMGYRTMAEAKHEYFENQEKYDQRQGTKVVKVPGITDDKKWANKGTPAQQIADSTEEPKKKKIMTVEETKLGVTMVLSKEDCKAIGIDTKKTTKEAIQEIRKRLGLGGRK